MTLGEPDASGRRSPVVKEGSEFEVACDVVIMALGTSPNPLLSATTPGLETDRRGCLVADEAGSTTREGYLPAAMPLRAPPRSFWRWEPDAGPPKPSTDTFRKNGK